MTNWNWNYFNRFPPSCWPIAGTVSVADAATYLGVTVATIQQMCASGQLSGIWQAGQLVAVQGASIHELMPTTPNNCAAPGDIQGGVGPTG